MHILKRLSLIALAVAALGLVSCAHLGQRPQGAILSQTSTIKALLEGGYDGVVTCGELRRQGDLGIGTFDRLDGELILIDGAIYQARADGTVVRAPDLLKVPFAAVTRFTPSVSQTGGAVAAVDALKKRLDELRSGDNLFYAVRVDGVFDYVKYRSVPPQVKPYPKLAEVAAHQPVFERRAIPGTLVGFWCPQYAATLNVPGWHLHFISEDRKSAGHLLDCSWQGGVIQAELISEVHLSLPQTPAFQNLQLGGDSSPVLKAVESGK
ncbi:MAG: acetolactate decarboxylase [bacterium]